MTYRPGYDREPAPERPKPSLVGFRLPNGDVELILTQYGRRARRVVTLRGSDGGLMTLAEAAAAVERYDPAAGVWRPVPRLTVYRWAMGGKLTRVRAKGANGTRPVMKVRLLDLTSHVEAQGGLRLRPRPRRAQTAPPNG